LCKGMSGTIKKKTFGIPLTKGKLLSKGKFGIVTSFNMRHLYLNTLLRAQLFTADQEPITGIAIPTQRIIDIFQLPLSASSPNFAFGQREFTALVFTKLPDISFSNNTRIVFWFERNSIPCKTMDGREDIPDEYYPLLKNMALLDMKLMQGMPVPKELLEAIEQEKARIEKEGNVQNYYLVDTFDLSPEEMNQLAAEDIEAKPTQKSIKDTLIDKCEIECKSRKLPQRKTISREVKFDIANIIGMDGVGTFASFKSGNSAYHRISKILSSLGYSEKNPLKYRK